MTLFRLMLLSSIARAPDEGTGAAPPADPPADAAATDEVAGLLDFEFPDFEEKPKGPEAGDGEKPAETQTAQGEKPAADAVGGETAEGPKEVDPKDAALATLQETIKNLTARQTAEPQVKKEETPKDEVPDFVREYAQVTIPKGFLTKLNSDDEDERLEALNGLTRSLLIRAHADARKYYDEKVAALRNEVPQLASTTLQQEQQRARLESEFFGEYPVLAKTPTLRQVALQTMYTVGLEEHNAGRPVNPFDPAFRRKVAERVAADLGGQLQAPQAPKAPPPAGGNGVKRPAFVAGSGARAGTPGTKDPTDEFAELLSIP